MGKVIEASCEGYGPFAPTLFVVHVSESDNGPGIASYCCTNAPGNRWHRTVGVDGTVWRHLGWTEEGQHDACINGPHHGDEVASVGVEHAGFSGVTDFSTRVAQLQASAAECAAFCRAIGRAPSRDFIIGHSEDATFGGCSTHTDPGPTWPWDDYMAMVEAAYNEDEEEVPWLVSMM